MALVYRNGRPRLQRSVWRGGKVTTEYVASGQDALLIAKLEAFDQEDKDLAKQEEQAERQAVDDLERALDDLAAQARALAHEALTAAGFHQHKQGEWRKRRGNRHRESRDG